MIHDLTFDEEKHEYLYGGKVVPSVTQIIKAANLIDESIWVTDWHMTRGRHIHKATELWDKGILNMESLDPQIDGYVRSYIDFRKSTPDYTIKDIRDVEQRVYHARLGYAGTLDREVLINQCHSIVDYKSGQPEPWHGLQLAGYSDAKEGKHMYKRFGLYLQSDGGIAKLIGYKSVKDFQRFYSALDIYHFKNGN